MIANNSLAFAGLASVYNFVDMLLIFQADSFPYIIVYDNALLNIELLIIHLVLRGVHERKVLDRVCLRTLLCILKYCFALVIVVS